YMGREITFWPCHSYLLTASYERERERHVVRERKLERGYHNIMLLHADVCVCVCACVCVKGGERRESRTLCLPPDLQWHVSLSHWGKRRLETGRSPCIGHW